MATLLVSGSAPPRPLICRGSGLPKMARITLSLIAGSPGRSLASRKTPLLVPPRMITARIRSDLLIADVMLPPIRAAAPGGAVATHEKVRVTLVVQDARRRHDKTSVAAS